MGDIRDKIRIIKSISSYAITVSLCLSAISCKPKEVAENNLISCEQISADPEIKECFVSENVICYILKDGYRGGISCVKEFD